MNAYGWVSLVALTGWLVLAVGSVRSRRLGARRTLLMATAWLGLFLVVAGIFAAIGR